MLNGKRMYLFGEACVTRDNTKVSMIAMPMPKEMQCQVRTLKSLVVMLVSITCMRCCAHLVYLPPVASTSLLLLFLFGIHCWIAEELANSYVVEIPLHAFVRKALFLQGGPEQLLVSLHHR